jgi:hypothetical protein
MGLWSRRARREVEPEVAGPDGAIGFFDARQGALFRALIRQAFAQAGLEVSVYADHVVDSGGRQFGLGNVAAACHYDPRGERAWPELTREHAERIVRAVDAPPPFETMSQQEVLAATYPRVIAAADVLPEMAYAREVAPGLVEVLNLDLPDTVAFFLDPHVERFGPVGDLRRAGLANVRRVQADEHEILEQQGGRVHALLADSMFMASAMLVLPEVTGRYEPAPDPDLGIFFALPFRHQLDFHLVRDRSAIPSLQLLAHFAAAGYQDAAGAITPEVYWWRPAGIERITRQTPDGIHIEVGHDLAAVLERLAT